MDTGLSPRPVAGPGFYRKMGESASQTLQAEKEEQSPSAAWRTHTCFAFLAEGWYTRAVTTSYVQTLRLFSRDLRLFLITATLIGLAWDGVRTVLLNLYLLRLGYGPESVGLINGVGALAFALSCPAAGAMGVRWGSRRVLIAGASLLAAGYWLLLLAEALTGSWRLGWLMATALLTNFGLALYVVNGLPFLMDATRSEERNHAFSFHIALVPLSAFVGSLMAGVLPGTLASLLDVSLGETTPYRLTLSLAALLLVPSIPVLLLTRSDDRQHTQAPAVGAPASHTAPAPYGLIAVIALIMALRFGGRATVITFFNVYLDDGLGVPTILIGVLTAVGQLLAVPAALTAPLLVARWGNPRTIFWGTMLMALCMLPLALVPHWAVGGLAFMSSTTLFSTTAGPIRLFSQELVAPRWRASMASAFMMGAGLAFSGTSLVGGYAIATVGYRTLFLGATGVAAAGALLFWCCFHVPRGEPAR